MLLEHITTVTIQFLEFRAHLLQLFKKNLVFKQHYVYFYTIFHQHVFSKNTNNITKNLLSNGPLSYLTW